MDELIFKYAETAFDSTRPRSPPPLRRTAADSARRRHPITGRGKQCGEYLGGYRHCEDAIAWLRSMDSVPDAGLTPGKVRGGIRQTWQSLKNPAAVVQQLTAFFGFWLCTAGLVSLFLALWVWGLSAQTLSGLTPTLFVPLVLYLSGKTALKRGWVKSKNNTVLNRCTGKVTFTYNKRRRSNPFDEFDPYLSIATNPTGSSNYYLRLVHRYSSRSVVQPDAYNTPWEAEVGWELLQQFMDVSQPLPDVPGWELTRRYDPTSIEYDQRHGRPPDYWKDRDIEQVRRWVDASRKAAEAFPWGSTREQALAMGWNPSGVGEGDWQGKPMGTAPAAAAGNS